MRILRGAAWTVFCLDLVILAQMAYAAVIETGGPTAQAAMRGLTIILGAGLLGVAAVLLASSWLRSRIGLWISLVCAAVPLLLVASAILGRLWE